MFRASISEEDAPLYGMLLRYARRHPARFHMPGHKGAAGPLAQVFGNALAFDVTELPETDNLFEASGAILEAERRAARLYGARETLFSAGGSTLCIQAMLRMAAGGRSAGARVVCARNVHRAAVNAMALLELEPEWVWPRPFAGSALPGEIRAEDVENVLARTPGVCAVYVTSPDYYGVLSDIAGIARATHAYGVPLLVDNAHGAHLGAFGLHPLPFGADLCCDSAHKTLPALTGGAFLHIADSAPADFTREAAKAAMALFGSTSPSYLIQLSLDLARAWLESEGRGAFRSLAETVASLRALCASRGFFVPAAAFDPARLMVDTASRGMPGNAAAEFLRSRGVSPEMWDSRHVVLLPSPFNPPEDFERLARALSDLPLPAHSLEPYRAEPLAPPCRVLPMRGALLAVHTRVRVEDAAGRVAAEAECPCPPGVPLVMPGERISEQLVNSLKSYGVFTVNVLK